MGRFTHFATLTTLICVASAQWVDSSGNDNAHIAYDGDISLTWKSTGREGQECNFKLGPQNHSYFYVGVSDRWNPSPFFFEIEHTSSVSCNSDGTNCTDIKESNDRFFTWTNDEIYNLDFSSAILEPDYNSETMKNDWQLQRTVDMDKAKISRAKLEGEDGYRVQLDKSSWLNNHTWEPGMTINNGDDSDAYKEGCYLRGSTYTNILQFEWDGTHDDFGIDFTFTNNHAKAEFYIKNNYSEWTLSYSGSRIIKNNTNRRWDYGEIELDTADNDMPSFTWQEDGKPADLSAPSTTSRSSTPSPTRTPQPTSDPTRTGGEGEETPPATTSPGSNGGDTPGSASFMNISFYSVLGWVSIAMLTGLFV